MFTVTDEVVGTVSYASIQIRRSNTAFDTRSVELVSARCAIRDEIALVATREPSDRGSHVRLLGVRWARFGFNYAACPTSFHFVGRTRSGNPPIKRMMSFVITYSCVAGSELICIFVTLPDARLRTSRTQFPPDRSK